MKILFFLSILFSVFPCISLDSVKAQTEDKALAKIGNISISEKEFIMRYEMTPHIGLHHEKMREALKEGFLYTIIAEKLFALNAAELKLDTNEIVRYTLNEYEKMFVRDALYKIVVKDKAKSKTDSLLSNYIEKGSEFLLTYIFSESGDEAERIYLLLEKGVPFDSLYVELNNKKNETLKIRIGDIGEDIESEFANVMELGYTKPIFLGENIAGRDGWYIFKMVKKFYPVLEKMPDWETEYKRLEKIAEERAEAEIYQKFMSGFFTGKKMTANGKLLKSTAEKISTLFKEKRGAHGDDSGKIFLNVYDLIRVENEFGKDSVNLPYIILDDKTISLQEFLRHFRFENFSSDKTDFQTITSLLSSKTKKFIEQEILTEEGYKRNLQNSDEVKESYNMSRDNYLFQVGSANAFDSEGMSDRDMTKEYDNYLNENKRSVKINIVEILTDSLETVEKILNEIDAGKDMHELAVKYSERNSTKSKRGEFGLFSPEMHGEIGRIAAAMEVGELYGPLKVPEGYSIFQLIDKRVDSSAKPVSFEEYSSKGTNRNFNINLDNYTAKLALKYGIEINYDLFKSTSTTTINTMWFRYLGFGGKITAVPLLAPNSEWVKSWLEQKNLSP